MPNLMKNTTHLEVNLDETPSETAAKLILAIEEIQAEGTRQQLYDTVATFLNDFYSQSYEDGYDNRVCDERMRLW